MASRSNSKKTVKTVSRANKNKKSNTKQNQSIKDNGVIQDEIILLVVLVICILLFLSNFDLSGQVGEVFRSFLFGMVGLEAYILPFALFFGTAFHISNPGSKRAGRKIMSACVFLVALASFLQLVTTDYDGSEKIYQYYQQSAANQSGGGIIGGIFVMILCGLFDTVATYVILIAVMLISIIVITGKALFTYLAKQGKRSYDQRREYQKLRKEQMEMQQEAMSVQMKQGRRPAKTFLLDPESALAGTTLDEPVVGKGKERKKKKGEKEEGEELTGMNLDHLFSKPSFLQRNPQEQKPEEEQAVVLPGYEAELREKFGNPDLYIEEPQAEELTMEEITAAPAPLEAELHNDETAVVQTKQEETPISKKSEKGSTDVEELHIDQTTEKKEYIFPPTNLLNGGSKVKHTKGNTDRNLKETALKLQSTLESFGVHVTITNVSCGPSVTRYELQPEQGVKVSRITSLADDIKLNLAAADVRIEAPIPGKAAVGIEVPNKENSMVTFREMIESNEFTGHPSDIAFAVGKDIGGQTIITDIGKMPHLLIAGATGSGKSVCINTLVMSILYKANPSDVRLIMVDPKVVELNIYNGIPHLLIPVVTDPKKASAALNWAVVEMTERYKKFADAGVRDLKGYNEKVAEVAHLKDENYQKLPQIIIIIDELADLMMVAPGEVEDAICRLAQMARAAGLHLIIATQRPSVNVITGLIKANIPSRIAFAVSSAIDSRTIIDGSGAEKLLGKGDMLFFPSGYPKPVRIQGAFISDKEVGAVVDFLKKHNNETGYSEEINEKITNARSGDISAAQGGTNERDDYFIEAGKFIIEKDKASIGMLQRVYKIGFNRAARIMDQLAEAGVVGPEEGTKPRKILMSEEQFEQYVDEN